MPPEAIRIDPTSATVGNNLVRTEIAPAALFTAWLSVSAVQAE